MIALRYLPTILALLAAGGAALWLWLVVSERDDLRAEVARQARSLAAMEQQIEQSRLAREVEAARAAQWQARSAELNETIETILRGIEDAPLDPDLADRINGLLRRD